MNRRDVMKDGKEKAGARGIAGLRHHVAVIVKEYNRQSFTDKLDEAVGFWIALLAVVFLMLLLIPIILPTQEIHEIPFYIIVSVMGLLYIWLVAYHIRLHYKSKGIASLYLYIKTIVRKYNMKSWEDRFDEALIFWTVLVMVISSIFMVLLQIDELCVVPCGSCILLLIFVASEETRHAGEYREKHKGEREKMLVVKIAQELKPQVVKEIAEMLGKETTKVGITEK